MFWSLLDHHQVHKELIMQHTKDFFRTQKFIARADILDFVNLI